MSRATDPAQAAVTRLLALSDEDPAKDDAVRTVARLVMEAAHLAEARAMRRRQTLRTGARTILAASAGLLSLLPLIEEPWSDGVTAILWTLAGIALGAITGDVAPSLAHRVRKVRRSGTTPEEAM